MADDAIVVLRSDVQTVLDMALSYSGRNAAETKVMERLRAAVYVEPPVAESAADVDRQCNETADHAEHWWTWNGGQAYCIGKDKAHDA